MENKTSYSLQDAKEYVAKENGFKDWIDCFEVIGRQRLLHESFLDAVAELYKEKATEELRKSNSIMNKEIKLFMLEIERLKDQSHEQDTIQTNRR